VVSERYYEVQVKYIDGRKSVITGDSDDGWEVWDLIDPIIGE